MIYVVAARKFEVVSEAEVEKALRPVWLEISYLARERKHGTVEEQTTIGHTIKC